ncbi:MULTISPECIES: WD40 repeat domain-containing protein [Collinsella]|uniref:WD40 repeat domain-containing protein n=1 Tax=Collinsella TaxID=102106 RepID=UPI00117F68A4|nr:MULTISPECIES: hypothetical protein [Collinsella]MBM6682667.1 hypothetical protein [Collinsella intestinalis]
MDTHRRERFVLLMACETDAAAATAAADEARRAGYEVRFEMFSCADAPGPSDAADTSTAEAATHTDAASVVSTPGSAKAGDAKERAESAPDADVLRGLALCVVLLSEATVGLPGFLDCANHLAELAPAAIPVRLDDITPERCGAPGSPIRERHWADARTDGAIWQKIFHSHVWLYGAFDDLAARSARWETCGRDDSFLIQQVAQAQQALSLISEMRDDSFQPPTATMVEYARASLVFADRQRRRTRRRGLVFAAAVVAAVAVVAVVRGIVSGQVADAVRTGQAIYNMRLETDPAFFTFQTYRSMLDADEVASSQVSDLAEGLERPWATGMLGTENFNAGEWQGEGVMALSGTRYWVRASGGALQQWDLSTFDPLDTVRVSSSDAFAFDVTADGAQAVIADAEGVALVDLTSGERSVLDGACTDGVAVVCSADGSQIAVQTTNSLAVYEDGSPAQTLDVSKTQALALARTSSGLLALCAEPAAGSQGASDADASTSDWTLRLIDLTAGKTVRQAPLPDAEVLTGAVSPQGDALVCANGQVLALSNEGELRPIGFTTYDAPDALATDGSVLVVATAQDGVQVVDLATGAKLGTIANDIAGVCYLAIGKTGTVACGNGFVTSVWSLDTLVPHEEPSEGSVTSAGASSRASGVTAEVVGEGLVRVTRTADTSGPSEGTGATNGSDAQGDAAAQDDGTSSDRSASLDIPLDSYGDLGAVSSVCVAPDGDAVAVGFASGTVLAFDLTADGEAHACRAWRVPTAEEVTQVGFSADGVQLMVEADGRWWHPWSNSGCTSMSGAEQLLRARQPRRWALAQWQTFPEEFRTQLGMTCAAAAPSAR